MPRRRPEQNNYLSRRLPPAAHKIGALIVLDTVTSLGGIPVKIDEWDIDPGLFRQPEELKRSIGSWLPLQSDHEHSKYDRKTNLGLCLLFISILNIIPIIGEERTHTIIQPRLACISVCGKVCGSYAEDGLENTFQPISGECRSYYGTDLKKSPFVLSSQLNTDFHP